MKTMTALKRAERLGHDLALQSWSPIYERWKCAHCDAELILTGSGAAHRKGDGAALDARCANSTAAPLVNPVQTTLFDDSAVDDWGDARDKRLAQPRLL